jgi:Superinfection immunity protein
MQSAFALGLTPLSVAGAPMLHNPGPLLLALAIYFAPSAIAFHRQHHNLVAIVTTNLVLGWTFFGWLLALAWSFSPARRPSPA